MKAAAVCTATLLFVLTASHAAQPPLEDRYNLRRVVADEAQLARFYKFMDPSKLIVGGKIAPNWMRDGMSFWYAQGGPQNTSIVRVDAATGRTAPLLDVAKTRAGLAALLGRDPPYQGLPFDSVAELGDDRYGFSFEGVDYILSTRTYTVEVGPTEKNPNARPQPSHRAMWLIGQTTVTEAPSPDKQWFASLKDGNIMLRSPADGRSMALTSDGTQEFAWDVEGPRTRITVDMELRQFLLDPWSPDGTHLFAIKMDRRAVPLMPTLHYLKREEEASFSRIQRAGGALDISYPHVIDVLSKRAVALDVGDPLDQYFVLIGWRPDGSEVLFSRHSRDFKTVDVLAGNPVTGKVRTVLSDSAKTFVTLQHDVIFYGDNHITMLPDGSGLIWRSSRSGWNHLYLYSMDGKLVRALTKGEYPVMEVLSVDQAGGWVYFSAHHDQQRPYDVHLCRVKLTGGEVQRLTPLDGVNLASMSPSNKAFTVVNSRPDRPFRTDLHTSDGKKVLTVQQADITALSTLGYVPPEEFTVTAADGQTKLWGVMYKPVDFDPNKKYPVIDHLYGGPQMAKVAHHYGLGSNSHDWLDRALAQLGYIVISVDARGTPERSKAFQDVVYRNWGRNEIPDHAATIQQLARRHSFMDSNRVGVFGHSWGGYFTVRALAQAPDVFHVGVGSAPGTDPHDMNIYEPYLDLPSRAKAEYDYANNQRWMDKIRGKLMLVVGTSDPANHSDVMEMVHNMIEAGVDHDLVVLPEAGHGYYGKDEDFFIYKLVGYFETYLKRRDATP